MASIEVIGGVNNERKDDKPKETETKKSNKLFKLFKKKPFLVAVVVVVALGLYAWFKKSQTATVADSESSEGYFIPTTYTYPTYSGGSYSDSISAYNEDTLLTMQDAFTQIGDSLSDSFDTKISQVQNVFDTTTSNLVSQVETLNDRLNDTENVVKTQSQTISKQNDIDAMMRNSDNYHYATTTAEKEALHNANKSIAEKWGFTFGDDGYWHDSDGSIVYSTATQEQKKQEETIATKKASTSGSSTVKKTGTTDDDEVSGSRSSGSTSKTSGNGSTTVKSSGNTSKAGLGDGGRTINSSGTPATKTASDGSKWKWNGYGYVKQK